MPQSHFDVLSAAAEVRGVDLSAVLNQLIADALPALRRELDLHQAATFAQESIRSVMEGLSRQPDHLAAVQVALAAAEAHVDRAGRDEAVIASVSGWAGAAGAGDEEGYRLMAAVYDLLAWRSILRLHGERAQLREAAQAPQEAVAREAEAGLSLSEEIERRRRSKAPPGKKKGEGDG